MIQLRQREEEEEEGIMEKSEIKKTCGGFTIHESIIWWKL